MFLYKNTYITHTSLLRQDGIKKMAVRSRVLSNHIHNYIEYSFIDYLKHQYQTPAIISIFYIVNNFGKSVIYLQSAEGYTLTIK